jgi:uncharacterized damage-inducible protein DinB
MTVDDLRRRYDYGYWANRKLFHVMEQMTTEQFTQAVAGSYGSVRNTMVHVLSAEWGWLERCGGEPRGPQLSADDYSNVAALAEAWATVERHVRTFLDTLRDEDLARLVEFVVPRGGGRRIMSVGELLQHAANHAVHHRGQVALLIRLLGYTPGNFDLLIYDAEKRAAAHATIAK